MNIHKLNQQLNKVLNESLKNIDIEEGRNEILRRFQDLLEMIEKIDEKATPSKEDIRVYKAIESIATDIMRTADYMQVALEDQ